MRGNSESRLRFPHYQPRDPVEQPLSRSKRRSSPHSSVVYGPRVFVLFIVPVWSACIFAIWSTCRRYVNRWKRCVEDLHVWVTFEFAYLKFACDYRKRKRRIRKDLSAINLSRICEIFRGCVRVCMCSVNVESVTTAGDRFRSKASYRLIFSRNNSWSQQLVGVSW